MAFNACLLRFFFLIDTISQAQLLEKLWLCMYTVDERKIKHESCKAAVTALFPEFWNLKLFPKTEGSLWSSQDLTIARELTSINLYSQVIYTYLCLKILTFIIFIYLFWPHLLILRGNYLVLVKSNVITQSQCNTSQPPWSLTPRNFWVFSTFLSWLLEHGAWHSEQPVNSMIAFSCIILPW